MKQGTQIQIKLRRMQELFFNATFFTSHGGASVKHMGDFRPKKKSSFLITFAQDHKPRQ